MKLFRHPYLVVLLIVIVGVVGSVPLFRGWRSHVREAQNLRSYEAVERLLEEGDYAAARVGLRQYLLNEGGGLTPEQRKAWRGLDVRVSEKLRDMSRLLLLYQQDATLFSEHEAAALLIVRVLGVIQGEGETLPLREEWRGRETQAAAWLALDADQLISEGRVSDAIELLNSQRFEGAADCGRLLRLAILHQGDGEKAATYMARAFAADPRNPDVRSFQGQLLENAGQIERARVEYVAALLANPRDSFRRQQLARFYIRQRNYSMAQQTLLTEGSGAVPEFIGLAGEFWTRMLKPEQEREETASEIVKPSLWAILHQQKWGVFWDDRKASELKTLERYANRQQEVFWLKLLQLLKDGEEAKAAEMLEVNPFRSVSYAPDLENALRIVLRYRLTKVSPTLGDFPHRNVPGARHVLLEQIDEWSSAVLGDSGTLPASTERFLRGPQVWAGLILATGWVEAALQLVDLKEDVSESPEWFTYGIAQALRYNRSPVEALAFIKRGPITGSMELLRGEILLAQNEWEQARAVLEPLVSDHSAAGYRAVWLLATSALEKGNTAQAKSWIRLHPQFQTGVIGQELLARCELAEGNEVQAREIYTALGESSMEAATFLAREAFVKGDWAVARQWTEFLLDRYPDELQLRANLLAIEQAERESASSTQ